MSTRNIASLVLTLISLGFLIPGLTVPILSIDIGAKIPLLGEISLHHTKQSVIGTIMSLFKNGNGFVAFLILLFSILVPVIKGALILIALLIQNLKARKTAQKVLNFIGKWSMADVFIVAIFVAFLSTSSEDNINARIHSGFYFFLIYCILSIVAFQLFQTTLNKADSQK
jgi:uncharacterized paraquat-inducible protein A